MSGQVKKKKVKSRSVQGAIQPTGIPLKEKRCPSCKETKNASFFSFDKNTLSGLSCYCKECRNEKGRSSKSKRKDKIKIYGKKRYEENKPELLAKMKIYYDKNKDKILAKRVGEVAERIKETNKIWRKNNEEHVREKSIEWKNNNPDNIIKHNQTRTAKLHKKSAEKKAIFEQWAKNHPEIIDMIPEERRVRRAESARQWRINNPEKYKQVKDDEVVKRKLNPKEKLKGIVSGRMRETLKIKGSGKGNRKWEILVGYSCDELKLHIESQFTEGMNWECFLRGEIHIDHKIPLVVFNFTSPDDDSFKKAWSLKNLQPLWAFDNMSKGDKILYPELLNELLNKIKEA